MGGGGWGVCVCMRWWERVGGRVCVRGDGVGGRAALDNVGEWRMGTDMRMREVGGNLGCK